MTRSRKLASLILSLGTLMFAACSANEEDYRSIVRRSGTDLGAAAEAFDRLAALGAGALTEITDPRERAIYLDQFARSSDAVRLRAELTARRCTLNSADAVVAAVGNEQAGHVVVTLMGTCVSGENATLSALFDRGASVEPPAVSAHVQQADTLRDLGTASGVSTDYVSSTANLAANANSASTSDTSSPSPVSPEARAEVMQIEGGRVVSRTLDLVEADRRLQVERDTQGTTCDPDGTCTTASGWGLPSRCSVCRTVAGFLINVGLRSACRWGGLAVCGRVGLANPLAGAICIPVVNIVCRLAGRAISHLTRDRACRLIHLCN